MPSWREERTNPINRQPDGDADYTASAKGEDERSRETVMPQYSPPEEELCVEVRHRADWQQMWWHCEPNARTWPGVGEERHHPASGLLVCDICDAVATKREDGARTVGHRNGAVGRAWDN
jgi:hypothetical protein